MSELYEAKKQIEVLENVPMNPLPVTYKYDREKVELIRKTVAKDASDLELQLFIEQCKRTGLDPITRQIFFIKDKNGKVQIQTSIDGFRLIAERSKEYRGQTAPQWCGDDGKWVDVWLKKTPPSACKIGVFKKDFIEPLYAVALFDEYAQKKSDGSLTFMWQKMPALMIAKVAESLALRKAFPNDLSGLYTSDEMAQAEIVEVEPERKTAGEWSQPKKIVASGNEGILHSNVTQSVGIGNDAATDYYSSGRTTNDSPNDSGFDAVTGLAEFDHFRIGFGKYKDKKLSEISPNDLLNYYNYLNRQIVETQKPASPRVEEFLTTLEKYLNIK